MNALGSNTSATHAKVLQIECQFGVLLQDTANGFCWVQGGVPVSLYGVETTSGANTFVALKSALTKIPFWNDFSSGAKINLRHSATDRYPANYVAERMMNAQYPDSTLTHTSCDIHKLYSVVKGTLLHCDGDISGVLAVCLSAADAGSVAAMRGVLARVFLERLEVIHDMPPPEHKEHRDEVFETFLPVCNVTPSKRKLNLKRRFVISYFLTGPLSRQAIQHHCPWGCCPSTEATLKFMVVHLAWALIPHRCPIFPRSRWTNVDAAFDWLGLLNACHGLLEPVVYHITGKPPKPLVTEPIQEVQAEPMLLALDDDWDALYLEQKEQQCGEVEQQAPTGDGQRQNLLDDNAAAAINEVEAAAVLDPRAEEDAFKKEKRQNKAKARAWVGTAPLARLIVIKETVCVLMTAMYSFLRISGHIWERRQRLSVTKTGERCYRMLEAYNGKHVQAGIDDLRSKLGQRPKALISFLNTAKVKALRFRLIARAMCLFHVLLRLPRSGFPYRLFSALGGSKATVQSILDARPCSHDALADLLLRRYASLAE